MNISCKFEKARYNIFFVRVGTANNKGGIWPKVTLKTIAKVNKLDAGILSLAGPDSRLADWSSRQRQSSHRGPMTGIRISL